MFAVTPAASQYLSDVLENAGAEKDQSVRLVPTEQGLVPQISKPVSDDTTFEHEGETVLVVSQQVGQALQGKTLDVEANEELNRPKLTLVDATSS